MPRTRTRENGVESARVRARGEQVRDHGGQDARSDADFPSASANGRKSYQPRAELPLESYVLDVPVDEVTADTAAGCHVQDEEYSRGALSR